MVESLRGAVAAHTLLFDALRIGVPAIVVHSERTLASPGAAAEAPPVAARSRNVYLYEKTELAGRNVAPDKALGAGGWRPVSVRPCARLMRARFF
jgi:hypothetical protein